MLLLPSSVTLCELLNLSEPCFFFCKKELTQGYVISSYVSLFRLNETIYKRNSLGCLALVLNENYCSCYILVYSILKGAGKTVG